VQEETGLDTLHLDGEIETIDWFFRFRGRLVHKVCHFYLMRSETSRTKPQRAEGITACRWARYDEATQLVSYANAREVLARAHAMVRGESTGESGREGTAETIVVHVTQVVPTVRAVQGELGLGLGDDATSVSS
jgi:hypothetical protein